MNSVEVWSLTTPLSRFSLDPDFPMAVHGTNLHLLPLSAKRKMVERESPVNQKAKWKQNGRSTAIDLGHERVALQLNLGCVTRSGGKHRRMELGGFAACPLYGNGTHAHGTAELQLKKAKPQEKRQTPLPEQNLGSIGNSTPKSEWQ